MGDLIGGMFSNDSLFGRIMTKIGIIVAANLLFALCTVPVITIGPGFAALHYTMLKMLRGNGELNPFKTFWKGLKDNFKQALAVWCMILAAIAVLYLEWYWCSQFGGVFVYFQYGLLILGACVLVLFLYIYPTMAAFRAPIKTLAKNSIYFAIYRPFYLIVILFFSVFPMIFTYTDNKMMPLYGFLWVTCGYALVCLLTDALLLREFRPYLPEVDEYGGFVENNPSPKSGQKQNN